MSSVETLGQRIKREDTELAKMRQDIQDIVDEAASRGVHFNLKEFPESKKPCNPSSRGGREIKGKSGAGNPGTLRVGTSGPLLSVEEKQ